MSETGKKKKNTAETPEKVLTRYDRKMQKREEQKRKEQRDKRIFSVVGIVLLVGLVCFVLSFPIRSWRSVYGTYIVAADEKVTRVEFDYNYSLVKNNYISQNAYMLSYFGLDLSGDLSTEMYSETMSWKDFFEELAVRNLLSGKAMRRDMEAAGFSYDESADYERFMDALREAASEEGTSFGEYLRALYGQYATEKRVEDYIRLDLKLKAYSDEVSESKAPSEEEIQAYYEDSKNSYDSVDYHLLTINAELPTEPTELADPVEETEGEAGEEDGEEAAYEPSEAEIEAAMSLAKTQAEEKQAVVAKEGEEYVNVQYSAANYHLTDWLFDSERKEGDTTVIEDTVSHCYYVVSFDGRYLDQTPTVTMRAIITQKGNAQSILDEWAAGEATEDSFAALADQYNNPLTTALEGGLVDGLEEGTLTAELSDWLFDEARVYGDTAVITPEGDSNTYILYYAGTGDPSWKMSIRQTLLSQTMDEYVSGLQEGLEVEDPHHNLDYIEIRAQEEAEAAEEANDAADTDGGTEDGDAADNSSAE